MPHVRLKPNFTLDQERLDELKKVVPEAFADGKINWETLRAALGQQLEEEGENAEHFGLNWPGKRKARQLAFTPSTGTLVPVKGEGVNEEETKNTFIEGENLEVLKLLQKSYAGKIKMIYIDPPYNTGNDFIYPDNFSAPLDTYLRLTGQVDSEGDLLTTNPQASGRFHSTWLSMMYPRLFLAKRLLADDGAILVSINDIELPNLRLLMDLIFGEENFIATFIWKSRHNVDSRNKTGASIDHEYVLCYGLKIQGKEKDLDKYTNPDNDPRGPWMSDNLVGLATKDRRPNLHYDLIDPKTKINYGCPEMGWRYEKSTMAQKISEGRILWPRSPEGRPRHKKFLRELLSEFTGFSTLLDAPNTGAGTQEIRELFGAPIIEFPKPVGLIKLLLSQTAGKDGLILDFFAGSGTTAQSVLELNREDGGNRRFILVQLPQPTPASSPAEKAGFKTIADICKERIRRAIKPKKSEDSGFRVFKLAPSSFRVWQDYSGGDIKELENLFDGHNDPLRDGWKKRDLLTEILLHEGVMLTAPIRKDATIKKNDVLVVEVNERRLLICLDEKLYAESLSAITLGESDTLICLDSALTDEQKLRLADKGLLKTI